MGKPIITVLDAVHCKANKYARPIIKPVLAYRTSKWKRDKSGRKKQVFNKSHLITGRKGSAGTFLTGLLPRIIDYTEKKKKQIKIVDKTIAIEPTAKPNLKGITFRRDQRKALRAVRRYSRGKIVAPPGSGKTLVAAGIISMFPELRVLFLAHLSDLVNQSAEVFRKYFKNVYAIGAGNKANWESIKECKSPIVISTIQSFSKIPQEVHFGFFDMTIVDETHHVNKKDSQYGQIMETNLCPRRYGLTATVPTKDYEILMNEGYFGPTIAELTIQQGIEAGIIAKPEMNLVPVPYSVNINKKCEGRYKKYYEFGIVKNRVRNKLIADEVIQSIKAGEIVLVIIERKEHGKRIQNMLKYKGTKIPFVFGDTKKEKRNKIKDRLKSGKLKGAICSRIWKEGVNIPSLNHVVNACGLKEEKMVLQAAGRGLRTTENKTTIKITDFLDPYKFLAEHSVLRTSIYIRKGWLK